MIARKAVASATRPGFSMTMATTSSTKAFAVSFLHLFARRASPLMSKGSQPSTGKTTRRKVNRIGEYRGFCATPCWFVAARRPITANRIVCGCASHYGLYGGTTLRAALSPPGYGQKCWALISVLRDTVQGVCNETPFVRHRTRRKAHHTKRVYREGLAGVASPNMVRAKGCVRVDGE